MYKDSIAIVLSFLILVFGYGYFGNYLDRSNFILLFSLYGGLFLFTFQVVKNVTHFKWLIICGIIFRFLFIIATPNLSQDFYRFIWDGHLVLNGVSPYVFTPEQFINNLPPKELLANWGASQWQHITIPNADLLYQGMGILNGSHYSNYPPLNQFCFTMAALLGGKSILGTTIALRLIVILADIGILYFGKKLLVALQLPLKNIFWYFLNPFIIIELTGNLHFEGVMLFFVIAALYYLYKKKWIVAALLLGCSISLKLLPLLFLPLFFQFFMKKKTLQQVQRDKGIIDQHESKQNENFTDYQRENASTARKINSNNILKLFIFYVLTGTIFILSFLPFASGNFIANFSESITLWFGKFEFNASIYYIIRWIGYQVVGWNIIETVGKVLPLVVFISVLLITFFRNNKSVQQLITALLLCTGIYFLLGTTVHPWYVATPLLLGVFTRYRFPLLWSFLVFLSYSAYQGENFQENMILIALEYCLVIGYVIWEIFFSMRDRKTTTTLKTS